VISRRLAAGVALACGLLGGGASADTPKAAGAEKKQAAPEKQAPGAPVGAVAAIDRPAALVGDQVIWKSQLDDRVAGQARQTGQAPSPQLVAKVLEEMIETELIVQHARAVHIEVEPSEVDAALAEIKQQNQLDDAGLDAVLAESGFTRAMYREELVRQLLVLRHDIQVFRVTVTVTDEDVTKALAARGAGTGADRDRLRQELTRERVAQARVEWLAKQKRRVRIVRRP
jgi:parvulin-like peptidyl-prolyl isomerase